MEGFADVAVTNKSPDAPRANRAEAGAPTIAGAPRVGATVIASTAEIADEDGLTQASFAYQWTSSGDGEIAGATGPRYEVADTDVGVHERRGIRGDADERGDAAHGGDASVGVGQHELGPRAVEHRCRRR